MTHNILVNAYRIAPDRIMAGTAGSYGLERMALTFSEEWKDVAKTVTFYPPKSRPVSVVLADGDEFDIPPEATAKSGEISFTVLGYRDGKRIFSVTGEMLVLATQNKEGVPSEEPTPSEKEQILGYVQDVKDMIEAGKIKGEDGYTPIKGVDYFDGKDGTSVAITEIDQTDEPGGESVVTFSDGKTLSVRNGLDGDDHLLVVTVNGTKASHTAAEINAFVQRGGTAALVLGGNVFNPQIIGAKMCRFSAIFNSASGATEWLMDVDASGTATFSNVVLDSLKNPNAITFTGAVEATYDGSRAVEVVIPEGEKQNLLVVTVDDGMRASHSATDVDAFVKNGGAVVLVWSNKVLHAKSVDAFLCRFGTMFNSPEGTTEWVMDVDQYGVAVFSDVICSALPSPNPIIFRGAVNETYDGSEEVIVEIPEGGGGNSVYFTENEPPEAQTGDFWYDESDGESGGGSLSDAECLALLVETDMLPAVYNADGKILTDENGKIILRY